MESRTDKLIRVYDENIIDLINKNEKLDTLDFINFAVGIVLDCNGVYDLRFDAVLRDDLENSLILAKIKIEKDKMPDGIMFLLLHDENYKFLNIINIDGCSLQSIKNHIEDYIQNREMHASRATQICQECFH